MNLFNEQTFLQILRSSVLSCNEYVQKELNVLADLLEEYGVESPSELKQKLSSLKKKSTSISKKSKYDLFVDDYLLCIANKDAGENIAVQIETLVQKFQELTPANIKKFAGQFELLLCSRKDAPQFRTWLQTGQKPLAAEEEKALLSQEITQIYQSANGNFTEENIQAILEIVKGIKDKFNVKELKEFVQTFESDLTAGTKDALTQKWEERLRGVKPAESGKPKRPAKQTKSFDLENNPHKDEINGLFTVFNENPNSEAKREILQKIAGILETIKSEYNFTTLKKFVQKIFSPGIKSNKADDLFAKTITFIEKNLLYVPDDSSQKSQTQGNFQPLDVPTQSQDAVVTVIENYVREAVQLRDEKSYELTDENILKIAELAEEIKKAYKIEGLKSFMKALGVNVVNVKNGALIEKLVNHLEDVALMRFKAVQMREME